MSATTKETGTRGRGSGPQRQAAIVSEMSNLASTDARPRYTGMLRPGE